MSKKYIEAELHPKKGADYDFIKNWFKSKEFSISPTKMGYWIIADYDTFKTYFNDIKDDLSLTKEPFMELVIPNELELHVSGICTYIYD